MGYEITANENVIESLKKKSKPCPGPLEACMALSWGPSNDPPHRPGLKTFQGHALTKFTKELL